MRSATERGARALRVLRVIAARRPRALRYIALVVGLLGVRALAIAARRRSILDGFGVCLPHTAFPWSLVGARWLAFGIMALVVQWMLSMFVATRRRPPRRPILGPLLWAAPLHLAGLTMRPFLSQDPVAYAVDGRVIVRYAASPFAERGLVMPHDDPYYLALPPEWREGSTAYYFGFHHICAWIERATGVLVDAIRAHQIAAAVLVLATAAVVGSAARAAFRTDTLSAVSRGNADRAAAFATTFVAASPTAVLEGSVSAHNDVWMTFAVAVAIWLLTRGHRWLAVLAVLPALSIKLSGALPLVVIGAAVLGAHLHARVRVPKRAPLFALAALVVVAVVAVWLLAPKLSIVTPVLAATSMEKTTTVRSLESLPRWLLERSGAMDAQHRLGLLFRVAGIAALLAPFVKSLRTGRVLPWLAPALFVFFAYTFARNFAWYHLLVLPMIPFCDRRWWRALAIGTCCWALTWPFEQAVSCGGVSATAYRVTGLFQLALVTLPPLLFWLRDREVA